MLRAGLLSVCKYFSTSDLNKKIVMIELLAGLLNLQCANQIEITLPPIFCDLLVQLLLKATVLSWSEVHIQAGQNDQL